MFGAVVSRSAMAQCGRDPRLPNEPSCGFHGKDKHLTLHLIARYSVAEQDACAQKPGLWREKEPVPPWGWRKVNSKN